MGENYFVPLQFELTDDRLFSILWVDNNYRVFDGCPDRTGQNEQNFVEVSSWGFTRDIGSTNFGSNSHLLVSSSCPADDNNITTVDISRNVLDAPNFAPYEPFYFLSFLLLSVWMLAFATKTIFGGGWKW